MDNDDTEVSSSSSKRRRGGGIGRFFTGALAVLIILGLTAVVLYLLSDINQRRYRLSAVGKHLVVERGRFLPFGFERYIPKADALKEAYAPIPLPKGMDHFEEETFGDRADIDRALFALLAGWARRGLESNDPKSLKVATKHIERTELLPGLSEQQRLDLRTLRADLAYRRGRRNLSRVIELLNEALSEFKLSMELGTSRPTNAADWITDIERRIGAYTGQQPGQQQNPLMQLPPGQILEPQPRLDPRQHQQRGGVLPPPMQQQGQQPPPQRQVTPDLPIQPKPLKPQKQSEGETETPPEGASETPGKWRL